MSLKIQRSQTLLSHKNMLLAQYITKTLDLKLKHLFNNVKIFSVKQGHIKSINIKTKRLWFGA